MVIYFLNGYSKYKRGKQVGPNFCSMLVYLYNCLNLADEQA